MNQQIPNVNEQINILEQQLNVLKQQQTYEQKQAQPKIYADIPKKTAALEVLKHLKTSKLVGVGAIGGVFVVVALGVFNPMVSYAAVGVLAIALGFYVYKVNTEIGRLKAEYGIQ